MNAEPLSVFKTSRSTRQEQRRQGALQRRGRQMGQPQPQEVLAAGEVAHSHSVGETAVDWLRRLGEVGAHASCGLVQRAGAAGGGAAVTKGRI